MSPRPPSTGERERELEAENKQLRNELARLQNQSRYEGDPASEVEQLQAHLSLADALVEEQAEDEGLWFMAVTASEAYLQQELRRLHAVIEATPEPAGGDDDA